MAQQAAHTQMYRSRDAQVAGVCAGIAERFDFDPIVVRILAILLAFVTFGLSLIVYVVLWVRMPLKPEPSAPYDVTPHSAESSVGGEVSFVDVTNFAFTKFDDAARIPLVVRLATAVILMLLFIVVSMNIAPMVPGTRWWQFWPIGVLIVGLFLIVVPVRNHYEAAWHSAGIVVTSLAAMMLPMSLGVMSWGTIPYAFGHAWPIVAAGLALITWGFLRASNAPMVIGALIIAVFCLSTLVVYSVPGDVSALFIHMPDGRSLRIAFAGWTF